MIQYQEGCRIIKEAEILSLLSKIDNGFSPPLSARIALAVYAQKIFSYAHLIIAYNENDIAGFCAFYDNDLISRKAFLTLIYTEPAFTKRGIALSLLETMTGILKEKAMSEIHLQVAASNTAAINLYQKCKFEIEKTDEVYLWMKKVI